MYKTYGVQNSFLIRNAIKSFDISA